MLIMQGRIELKYLWQSFPGRAFPRTGACTTI